MKSKEKMTVFISWSQKVSHEIAEILKEKLYLFFNKKIEFWVSSQDIAEGALFANSIMSALNRSRMGIICLDQSNYKRPWIYFETGCILGQNYDSNDTKQSIILPIIFDGLKKQSFTSTPFSNMQLSYFNKDTMERVVRQINNMYKKINGDYIFDIDTLNSFFEKLFENLSNEIGAVIERAHDNDTTMITGDNVVDLIRHYDSAPIPSYGDVIRFDSGFETNAFYRFLLENTKQRLYIFGRKNSKLSSEEFDDQFTRMVNRNIDIRLLFMNPNSEIAKGRIAQDIANFNSNLIDSIVRFNERYSHLSINIDEQCKMYSTQRECQIIIADCVVFYKDLTFSPKGLPNRFTNASFSVTATNSQIGVSFINQFSELWKTESAPLTKSFADSLVIQ